VLQDVPLVGFNHSSQWGYLTESWSLDDKNVFFGQYNKYFFSIKNTNNCLF
jgi:hypothetical protein